MDRCLALLFFVVSLPSLFAFAFTPSQITTQPPRCRTYCYWHNRSKQSSLMMRFMKSPMGLLELLTCALAIVETLASSSLPSGTSSPWGTHGGSRVASKRKNGAGLPFSKPSEVIRQWNGTEVGHDSGQFSYSDDEELANSPPKEAEVLDALIPATYVAETNLPTDIGHFCMRAYRIEQVEAEPHPLGPGAGLGSEPCVIYCADKPPFGGPRVGKNGGATAVPARIHDQCFTSEVFRSQRCDCKEQLNMLLEYIQKHGGIIIYLQQEGRGIGLANKIAAMALQDEGYDTVDANTHLGFPEDARQYGVVPSLLKELDDTWVRE